MPLTPEEDLELQQFEKRRSLAPSKQQPLLPEGGGGITEGGQLSAEMLVARKKALDEEAKLRQGATTAGSAGRALVQGATKGASQNLLNLDIGEGVIGGIKGALEGGVDTAKAGFEAGKARGELRNQIAREKLGDTGYGVLETGGALAGSLATGKMIPTGASLSLGKQAAVQGATGALGAGIQSGAPIGSSEFVQDIAQGAGIGAAGTLIGPAVNKIGRGLQKGAQILSDLPTPAIQKQAINELREVPQYLEKAQFAKPLKADILEEQRNLATGISKQANLKYQMKRDLVDKAYDKVRASIDNTVEAKELIPQAQSSFSSLKNRIKQDVDTAKAIQSGDGIATPFTSVDTPEKTFANRYGFGLSRKLDELGVSIGSPDLAETAQITKGENSKNLLELRKELNKIRNDAFSNRDNFSREMADKYIHEVDQVLQKGPDAIPAVAQQTQMANRQYRELKNFEGGLRDKTILRSNIDQNKEVIDITDPRKLRRLMTDPNVNDKVKAEVEKQLKSLNSEEIDDALLQLMITNQNKNQIDTATKLVDTARQPDIPIIKNINWVGSVTNPLARQKIIDTVSKIGEKSSAMLFSNLNPNVIRSTLIPRIAEQNQVPVEDLAKAYEEYLSSKNK